MANELEILWRSRRVDACFRRAFHAVAEEMGAEYGKGHGKILRVLSRCDGLSQKELAEQLGIRPQSLTDAVVRLEQQGAIVRTRSERDKREQMVRITDLGRERAEQVSLLHEQAAIRALTALNEEEKQFLMDILGRLIEANEEKEGKGDV